jgi:isopentenyl-diphosphate delta-isomerase
MPIPPPEEAHNTQEGIQQRKVDHLDLCAREDVEYRLQTTLLEEVFLMHQSLPELAIEDLDLTTAFVGGKRLRAPLCISGMTGGAPQARAINRVLAQVAQRLGLAFGVGSQRAMLIDPALTDTFAVREVAPEVTLLANIGAVQAARTDTAQILRLITDIGADALCVHLNPAQELIQAGGDRDFRGCAAAIARLAAELPVPVIAKETGCGLSPQTAAQLQRAGVTWVDVSGAGGTTWIGVEALRAQPGRRQIGEDLWEWGIPTAPAIAYARRHGLSVIASGGLRDGLDVARALAMGAQVASMALPFLRAAHERGLDGALDFAHRVLDGLQTAMLLSGARTPAALALAPRVLGPRLRAWIDQG